MTPSVLSLRVRALLAVVAVLAALVMSGAVSADRAAAVDPSPATAPAAAWLAGLVGPDGSVENPYGGGPSVAWTVNVALSLAAAGTEPVALDAALGYIADNVEAYVVVSGVDNPGRLGYLTLLAVATDADPTAYGTPPTDLVARLAALFGTTEAGVYGVPDAFSAATNQSLAILGLSAARSPVPAGAVAWLTTQQCVGAGTPAAAIGGWQPYRAPSGGGLEPCVAPDAATFSGPDTNSTAFAVQALVAAESTAAVPAALDFFASAQAAAGPYVAGFANYPATDPDPNSTAVVIQALLAAGEDLAAWSVGGATPLDSLAAWSVTSGVDAGALASPYSDGFADPFATYQGVWGLALQPFPFVDDVVPPVSPTTTVPPGQPSAEAEAVTASPVMVVASFTG